MIGNVGLKWLLIWSDAHHFFYWDVPIFLDDVGNEIAIAKFPQLRYNHACERVS